jgi:hypothetical protein
MYKLIWLFSLFGLSTLYCSCGENQKRQLKKINRNGLTAQGYVINDSIFDDTIYFFDNKGKLYRKSFYQNGKVEGNSIEFFENGQKRTHTTYSQGFKNGFEFIFDSTGKILYKGFYYFDLPVGPIILYDYNGSPKRFFFVNLQNETLLDIDYRRWNGIEHVYSNLINVVAEFQTVDTTKMLSIILYVIDPPKFKFDYSIVKAKKGEDRNFNNVADVKEDMPFKYLSMPLLPDSLSYSIKLSIYDSILNKPTILYKEI